MGLGVCKSRSGITNAHLNHSGQALKPRKQHVKQKGLRKNSILFKETFYTLIQLSVKLIDMNWDKTILNTCILSPEDRMNNDTTITDE